MSSKRPHPSDGPFSEPFRPRAPPDNPADNDAVDNFHERLASQRERRKWLEDERQSLRQDVTNYAHRAGQLCNRFENRGKTVSGIPKDTIRNFVRALRQLCKLNRLIDACDKNSNFLMGDIMHWRDHYRDTNAQDLFDTACTIWNRHKVNKWPSICYSLRSMAQRAAAQNQG